MVRVAVKGMLKGSLETQAWVAFCSLTPDFLQKTSAWRTYLLGPPHRGDHKWPGWDTFLKSLGQGKEE